MSLWCFPYVWCLGHGVFEGSCWAFSATGAIEGANAVATGNLVSVSEQELVTCDIGGESEGCNGGYMDDAFSWVIANGGIASEETYPYESYFGNAGVCDTKLVIILPSLIIV